MIEDFWAFLYLPIIPILIFAVQPKAPLWVRASRIGAAILLFLLCHFFPFLSDPFAYVVGSFGYVGGWCVAWGLWHCYIVRTIDKNYQNDLATQALYIFVIFALSALPYMAITGVTFMFCNHVGIACAEWPIFKAIGFVYLLVIWPAKIWMLDVQSIFLHLF